VSTSKAGDQTNRALVAYVRKLSDEELADLLLVLDPKAYQDLLEQALGPGRHGAARRMQVVTAARRAIHHVILGGPPAGSGSAGSVMWSRQRLGGGREGLVHDWDSGKRRRCLLATRSGQASPSEDRAASASLVGATTAAAPAAGSAGPD
jgi:hypothetical protein